MEFGVSLSAWSSSKCDEQTCIFEKVPQDCTRHISPLVLQSGFHDLHIQDYSTNLYMVSTAERVTIMQSLIHVH